MASRIEATPTQGSRRRSRSIWFHLHFWIAWIAAVPIALLCLTGAILAFEQEIFQWEHSELYELKVSDHRLTVGEVIETYQAADPPLRVNHLSIPQSPEHVYGAYTSGGRVFVNPYNGELSRLDDGFSISHLLIDVHRRLAAGPVGRQIAAISSLVLSISCVVGLVLWWPLRGRTFLRAWRRGWALDWHNALGLVALAPLIVMAVTGMDFTWGRHVWPILEGDTPSRPPRPTAIAPEGAEKLPIDVVVDSALSLMPDTKWTGFQPSNGRVAAQAFFFSDGSNHTQLFFDPYTGKELARHDGRIIPSGAVSWIRSKFAGLHTLQPFGQLAETLWGLLSLGGTVLVATGVWISVKRWRRPKRASAADRDQPRT
ncbi:MAG TPA: hypothetical protein EYQ18_18935 [Candidatus Handelsmanbacteria bacterium]|nr:hypothetical protein [Candidatus Handelsmanbacteria bacterium]